MTKVNTTSIQLKQWLIPFALASISAFIFYDPNSMPWTLFWFITVLGISFFAFEPIPNPITAILLVLSYVCFKVASPQVVFSGWLGFMPWCITAGVCLGSFIEKTGLAQRISLFTVGKIGKTPFLLFIAFLVTGYLMNFIIADVFTNTIVLGIFGVGICKALDLQPSSKAASSIMLACYFAGSSTGVNFYPNYLGLMAYQMLIEQGYNTTWVEFFINNTSLAIISSFVSLLLVYFYSRSEISISMNVAKKYITDEYNKLSRITSAEVRTFILLLLAVAGIVLEPYHGIPGFFLFSFIILLSFCPPFNLLDKDDFYKLNFGIVFFILGCMSIGFTAASLGVPTLITEKIVPLLNNFSSVENASVLTYFIGFLANFVLTPVAAATTLPTSIIEISTQLGLSYKPLLYSFLAGLDQWLFPYEAGPAVFLYATGYMRMKHILLIMSIRTILIAAVVWLNTVTVWSFMGL